MFVTFYFNKQFVFIASKKTLTSSSETSAFDRRKCSNTQHSNRMNLFKIWIKRLLPIIVFFFKIMYVNTILSCNRFFISKRITHRFASYVCVRLLCIIRNGFKLNHYRINQTSNFFYIVLGCFWRHIALSESFRVPSFHKYK